MGVMYDSSNADGIPAGAKIVAGYVDGQWPSYLAIVARFPNAQHVSITITAKWPPGHPQAGEYVKARVLDVENGDANPNDAPGWTQAMRAAGIIPCVYCSRLSAWPAVQVAFQAAFVAPPDYWIADYTNYAHLVQGSVATQWHDFGMYDQSETNGVWPGTAPHPPTPAPQPKESDTMTSEILTNPNTGKQELHVFDTINGVTVHWWQQAGGFPAPSPSWNVEKLPTT